MPAKKTLAAVTCLIALVTVTVAHPQTSSGCYPDPPPVLVAKVTQTVNGILENGPLALNATMPDLVFFTVADVAASVEIRKLDAYQYYGDLLRTDQQTGASSTSSGTTSAVEKPGVLQLLGFAIERGAIQQTINDTTVTLTTSPYAFVTAFGKKDTPETYKDNELLTRLAVSATFILDDTNNVASNFSRKQLTEWSAKLRLSGDRSPRSEAFQKLWQAKLGVLEQRRLDVFGAVETKIYNVSAINDRFIDTNGSATTPLGNRSVLAPLRKQIGDYLIANNITPDPDPAKVAAVPAANKKAIGDMIMCALFNEVHEPLRTGTIQVDAASLASALNQLTSIQQLLTEARAQFKKDLKKLAKSGTLSTFAYTNHRIAAGSDYSEFKLLFSHHVNPLEVVLNAGFSIYDKPDVTRNQERLRDFLIAGSLEWASNSNPLFRGDPELATPITFSLNGRYQRLMENENMAMRAPDLGSFQARFELPVAPGLSIPVAYTYSTATETMPKAENRFNVGLHLDINKLLSARKAAAAP